MNEGYVHTRDNLQEVLRGLAFEAKAFKKSSREVVIIGEVGLLLAERLEAIVNVLEELEKRL